MTLRLIGFVCILGILGLSGYAIVDKTREGTLSPVHGMSAAALATERTGADYVLNRVSAQLEQVHVLSGSYGGTLDLKQYPLVRLIYAHESAYCVEFRKTHTFFLAGPGGKTTLGSCPS